MNKYEIKQNFLVSFGIGVKVYLKISTDEHACF